VNKKLVRLALSLIVALAFSVGASAQDDEPSTPKKPQPKALQEARAKARERQQQARAKAKAEAEAKAVDINHASKAELMKLQGITDAYAEAIIAKRPYRSKANLVEKNAIPIGIYQSIRHQVAAK
jgi:DNA uptake protein ComE-like DNA-binding protein